MKPELGHPLLRLAIRSEPDIVTARQKTRLLADRLGFDRQDQIRLATTVSELTRNVYQYARTGTVEYFFQPGSPQTFHIRVVDKGPGITDLDSVLDGNYVSPSGMGVGLSGSRKLVDRFDIQSKPGEGTVIVASKFLDPRARLIQSSQLPRIVSQLQGDSPASPFEEMQNQNRDLLQALEELKASKQQLEELNEELEETNRGVLALYAELDEKARSLQRANEVKTSFLSNMTHEFRTPLSSIISLTRLLLQGVDGELNSEQEKQVNYIRKSGESLLELVNDLLDVAKVEAGKVAIQVSEFQIDELLGGLRGMFRPIVAEQPDVELEIEWQQGIPSFETDQAKLSQILRNLISNAVKFTESGHIRVVAQPEGLKLIRFTVSDTGIGISPEYKDAIFQDFTQVPTAPNKQKKGTGLGLPLARRLARLLGGELWVESEPGHGSTFHLQVPSRYLGASEGLLVESVEHRQDTGTRTTGSSFTVLIVDQVDQERSALQALISREINTVFLEASTGQEGLNTMRLKRPDVVFADVSGNRDGIDMMRQIAEDRRIHDIPVVACFSPQVEQQLAPSDRDQIQKVAVAVFTKRYQDEEAALVEIRNALARAGFDYKHA